MAKDHKAFFDNIKSLAVIILVIVVVRSTFAAPYKIPSGSMIPSLEVGDHIFVSKLSFGLKLPVPYTNINLWTYSAPKRGDIVVFEYPEEPSIDYIKRVVGVPGDTVEFRDRDLYINGQRQERIPLPGMETRPNRYGGNSELFLEQLGEVRHIVQYYQEYPSEPFSLSSIIRDMKLQGKLPKDLPDDRIPEGYYFAMGDNRDDSRDSRVWGLVPFENIRGLAKIVWLSLDTDASSPLDWIRFDRFFKIIR